MSWTPRDSTVLAAMIVLLIIALGAMLVLLYLIVAALGGV